MSKLKVSLEYDPMGAVHLYLDNEGAEWLAAQLRRISEGGHDHFMTEDWGGTELSMDKHGDETLLVHQLNVEVSHRSDS